MTILETMPAITSTVNIKAANGGHIIATNMIINPINCDEPCNATVTVTWKNTGEGSTKFKPAITINGTKRELNIEITLTKNNTTTQIFNLTNLMEGTYTICPYPN